MVMMMVITDKTELMVMMITMMVTTKGVEHKSVIKEMLFIHCTGFGTCSNHHHH